MPVDILTFSMAIDIGHRWYRSEPHRARAEPLGLGAWAGGDLALTRPFTATKGQGHPVHTGGKNGGKNGAGK